MFKINDTVFYKKHPNIFYTIIATPSSCKNKNFISNEWEDSYVYKGIDKITNKKMFFVRNKEDFESNFERKNKYE